MNFSSSSSYLVVGWLSLVAWACLPYKPTAQTTVQDSVAPPKFLSLRPAPSFDKARFWAMTGTGTAMYGGINVMLWKLYYKDFQRSGFHTFNDWDEWNQLDKVGHLFSTWTLSSYAFEGLRWTGMERRKAMWGSVGVGLGIMTTMETMDGLFEKWGFSIGDVALNLCGASAYVAQEMAWQEQRIQFKASGIRPNYSKEPLYSTDGTAVTTLDERAADLYGTDFMTVLLKDYNALTFWGSANVHSFLGKADTRFPKWLNLAVGYGAGNLYGGTENHWSTEDGVVFELDPKQYPRYRQYYLSLDIDWTRIPSKRTWVRILLRALNTLKMPAPAFELNSLGKAKFHYLQW